jgi:hypothetical protein
MRNLCQECGVVIHFAEDYCYLCKPYMKEKSMKENRISNCLECEKSEIEAKVCPLCVPDFADLYQLKEKDPDLVIPDFDYPKHQIKIAEIDSVWYMMCLGVKIVLDFKVGQEKKEGGGTILSSGMLEEAAKFFFDNLEYCKKDPSKLIIKDEYVIKYMEERYDFSKYKEG